MLAVADQQSPLPTYEEGLRRICLAPDDGGERRNYAKWLDRKGFHSTAELIRLQIDRFDDDVRLKRYRSRPGPREQQLLEQAPHVGDIAQYVQPRHSVTIDPGYELNRGFVEYVRLTARTLVEHADQLFQMTPLRHLEVVRTPEIELERILAIEHLSRLDTLSLPRWGLDDDDAATLAMASVTANLVGLDLVANRITLDGVAGLARLRMPSRLVVVDLTDNPCDPRDVPDYDDNGKIQFEPTQDGKELEHHLGQIRWLHPGQLPPADRYHLRLFAPPRRESEDHAAIVVPDRPWSEPDPLAAIAGRLTEVPGFLIWLQRKLQG